MPSMLLMADLICVPILYSLFKSFPKSLMAILAFVPESIASIRWDIGCPISMFTPLRIPNCWRTSARNSSLLRLSRIKGASISETLTPKACSSSSARPVLRATVCISGISISISSVIRPILSDSSREMPGIVLTLMVSEPSLNGGRKLRPSPNMITRAKISKPPVIPIISFLCDNAVINAFLYPFFRMRETKGSCSLFFNAFRVVNI